MSNVVGAAPLFVHRSGDAKSSSAVEPNDEDISGATALCNELPDDQRCIADQFYLDSTLADDTTTAIHLRLKRNSRWRNSGMIGGETHDCTSKALDSPIMRKRAAGVVSGEPNAARAEKSATATLNLQLVCSGARKLCLYVQLDQCDELQANLRSATVKCEAAHLWSAQRSADLRA
jgi:hypothetical protein